MLRAARLGHGLFDLEAYLGLRSYSGARRGEAGQLACGKHLLGTEGQPKGHKELGLGLDVASCAAWATATVQMQRCSARD